uniref:Uncharacterized protein n=1 Tax=Rhizophora mucronata TaxID=61149 RepID=A0A2P2QSR1_RHIMU
MPTKSFQYCIFSISVAHLFVCLQEEAI